MPRERDPQEHDVDNPEPLGQHDPDPARAAVAEALQELVDREARRRLVRAGVELVSARRGRRTATEAWLGSLTTHDPWLPASLPAKEVAALAAHVVEWARTDQAATQPTPLPDIQPPVNMC